MKSCSIITTHFFLGAFNTIIAAQLHLSGLFFIFMIARVYPNNGPIQPIGSRHRPGEVTPACSYTGLSRLISIPQGKNGGIGCLRSQRLYMYYFTYSPPALWTENQYSILQFVSTIILFAAYCFTIFSSFLILCSGIQKYIFTIYVFLDTTAQNLLHNNLLHYYS